MPGRLWATGPVFSFILLAVPFAKAQAADSADPSPQPVDSDKQTSSSGLPLQEVLVSARRKEEPLTTVPASITAYTSDFLARQNIRDFAD